MLVIRLQRVGQKNDPLFRIVVAEKDAPIKGKFIERVGFVNPKQKTHKIDAERIKHWLSEGAKPSDRVWNILVDEGVVEGEKRKVKIKEKKEKAEAQ